MKTNRLALALTLINFALLIFILAQSRMVFAPLATEVLRAKRIELVDDSGQVRSRLNVEPDGQVVLRLFDQDHTIRVKLGASTDGSGLVLLNDKTELGIQILANSDGARLMLVGKDGVQQVIEP